MAFPIDLDWLIALHAKKRLILSTGDRAGYVFVAEENPVDESHAPTLDAGYAYVSELIRLARLGAAIEAQGGRS